MTLQHIENALRQTAKVHAFCSGGGLRVVRIERKGKLIGYGEHPYIETAISHANNDVRRGCKPYKNIYGKKHPHYLTGSSSASSKLDEFILQGSTFDVTHNGHEFVVELVGCGQTKIPKDIEDEVSKFGETKQWTTRGFTFESSPDSFPNGEACITTKVVTAPNGRKDAWFYRFKKIGHAQDFWKAIDEAFKAPETEISEQKAA